MSLPYDGLALPELVAADVFEALLEQLDTTPGLVDQMLAGRPAKERDEARSALAVREGKVVLGFGREVPEDWQVTVALEGKGRDKKGATLGDVVSDPVEDPIATAALIETITSQPDVVVALASVPDGLPARGRVRIGDELALYELVAGEVVLRQRGILDTEAVAHLASELAVFHSISQRVGWSALSRLRVDVLGTNSRLLIILGAMLGALLVHGSGLFEAQGCTLHDVEETDLAPRPAEWGTSIESRTLFLTVRHEVSLPSSLPVVTDAEQHLTLEGVNAAARPEF